MLLENQYLYNKAIMVSLVGAPNVGKSSLINHLLGFDLTAVTNKPQTTRNQFHCTLTVDHTEIILVDTPGLHRSSKEINIRMNHQAKEGMEGADLNLLLVDLSKDLSLQFEDFKGTLKASANPSWVLFTKSDLLQQGWNENLLKEYFEKLKGEIPSLEKYYFISSKSGENIHQLIGGLCDSAKPGPHLYPHGEVSNKSERFFVTEYIREQAFKLLNEELPYEIAVVIDEYRDVAGKNAPREEGNGYYGERPGEAATPQDAPERKAKIVSYISATILVNRPSQRAIVVGSKGSVIKEIGIRARKKIEAMLGGQVHLNLHVKVSPHWYKNNFVLEELGLPRAPLSKRVWRKKL